VVEAVSGFYISRRQTASKTKICVKKRKNTATTEPSGSKRKN
jgi:hypothetical protein